MIPSIHAANTAPTTPTPEPYRLTRDQLLGLHLDMCDSARHIMAAKNTDYSGGNADCFGNFRAAEVLGTHPVIGLLMRCMDKFQRIRSFVSTGTLAVKSESVEDAIRDVINYMILLHGMIVEATRGLKGGDAGDQLQACNTASPSEPAQCQRNDLMEKAFQIMNNEGKIMVGETLRKACMTALYFPTALNANQAILILNTHTQLK